MKHIPLKTLKLLTDHRSSMRRSYAKWCAGRWMPKRAIDITEMRASIKLLDALDAADGTLELEDADYAVLKDKTLRMQWNLVDRRIVQLVDDVTNA